MFNSILLLVTIISDRLKYPHFHHTSDRPPPTNNIKHRSPLTSIKKRSRQISTLPPHKRSPLNKPTT
ncbi:MAG: hypothetical protein ACK491_07785 [Pseudanabaena sp.]